MMYSMVGVCALVVCLIINKNLIFIKSAKNLSLYYKSYRLYIFANILFFASDILWGLLDQFHIMNLLYADTILYFIAQSICIFLWTICVSLYINKNKILNTILIVGGLIIVAFLIVSLIINPFHPIIFKFDDDNNYITLFSRYIVLIAQEVMFFATMLVAFIIAPKAKSKREKNRCILVAIFSLFMALTMITQALYPLYPVYSIGLITSNCLIHIFIEMSDKEDNSKILEESLKREQEQRMELENAKSLINIDSLTGAKSKFAYLKLEDSIDELIRKNQIKDFAIVVFDINGLKKINDIKGHEYGDKYIIKSYQLIIDVFKDIPVYRFGGDEFVVFLDENYYPDRNEYLNTFNEIIEQNLNTEEPVLSAGMAIFDESVDDTFDSVFIKADNRMYEKKKYLNNKTK